MMEICAYRQIYNAQVIEMILKIQREEYALPITINDQPDLRDVENFYQSDGAFWVALDGDTVVGTIAVKNIGGGNAVVRKMFVKKEYRGRERGVSERLLSALRRWAGERKFGALWLGTTPQFLAAHRFYEKNGFKEVSREDLPVGFPVMAVDKKFYVCLLR